MLRYFVIAYIFTILKHFLPATIMHWWFIKNKSVFWQKRRIQKNSNPTIIRYEILVSLFGLFVQALFFVFLFELHQRGYLKVYSSWTERDYFYSPLAMLSLFAWHDCYFFWTHRLLHIRFFYRYIHIVHHKSKNPTAFASGSSHPIEAFIEVFFLLPFLMLVPIHWSALLLFLILTEIFSISGHLGVELLPAKTWDSWWGRWITTNTHHNLHHQYPNGNYALYGKFWDLHSNTLHSKTNEEFKRVTA